MALLKTISGIRGTIGGKSGDNLTPIDIVECVSGFGMWVKETTKRPIVVVGRDGRLSGEFVSKLSIMTLRSMGIDVIDLGYSTTPTVEVMVTELNANAGIIFTASHNPKEWNALKFLNSAGEFISDEVGKRILAYIEDRDLVFNELDEPFGTLRNIDNGIEIHVKKVLNYPLVAVDAVKQAKLKVIVDCINSTGALAIPMLLEGLGVEYELINADDFGNFAHNPEPLPQHLEDLSKQVISKNADMGISVDPDVDRLALVCEDGSMFGEEYTLVAVADYFLSRNGGNTVSNLSSTKALSDVTQKHGYQHFASAVGEVHVVKKMKEVNAVIGGEGNGGIIVPDFHYGRDAIIGIALILSHIANNKIKLTELRDSFPNYCIIKDKIQLTTATNITEKFAYIKNYFSDQKINQVDGLKIDFEEGWVHLRKSNTEPIIRIYAEARNEIIAQNLIDKVKSCL